MSIDAVKIPQNVHIEDRIVGPLTLRQVIICALGGGFSYALWAMISKAYGSVPLPIQVMVWAPAALAAIFAFVRINDLSMMRICLLFMEKITKPSVRTWSPRRGIIINVRTFHTVPQSKNIADAIVRKQASDSHLDELSSMLDRTVRPQPMRMESAEEEPAPAPQPIDEPMDDREEPLNMNTTADTIRRPVDPNRITANPVPSSLIRDISPAR